jgi:hypothetical protein
MDAFVPLRERPSGARRCRIRESRHSHAGVLPSRESPSEPSASLGLKAAAAARPMGPSPTIDWRFAQVAARHQLGHVGGVDLVAAFVREQKPRGPATTAARVLLVRERSHHPRRSKRFGFSSVGRRPVGVSLDLASDRGPPRQGDHRPGDGSVAKAMAGTRTIRTIAPTKRDREWLDRGQSEAWQVERGRRREPGIPNPSKVARCEDAGPRKRWSASMGVSREARLLTSPSSRCPSPAGAPDCFARRGSPSSTIELISIARSGLISATMHSWVPRRGADRQVERGLLGRCRRHETSARPGLQAV